MDESTEAAFSTQVTTVSGRASVAGTRLVLLLFAAMSMGQVLSSDSVAQEGPRFAAGVVLITATTVGALVTQTLVITGRGHRWLTPLILVQVGCGLAVLALVLAWLLMALPLASIMLVQPYPRWIWGVIATCLAGTVTLYTAVGDSSVVSVVGAMTTSAIAGYVICAVTRLVVVINELRRTRERLARLQVDEERNRISRDLHDLLGRTLVAASLRNETAIRLLSRDPERALHQLEELRTTVLDGQARLRALTSGPTLVGLTAELEAADEVLGRLDIRTSIDAVEVEDAAINLAFAAIVRESVTNMLKHSRPRTCRIGIRRESVAYVATIVNDQVAEPTNRSDESTGLRDLDARVTALGGTLTAGPVPGGHFRVIARIPDRAIASDSTPNPDGPTDRPTVAARAPKESR